MHATTTTSTNATSIVVAHTYASFSCLFRSSPLLFPTDGLKNYIYKYHVYLRDTHGIFFYAYFPVHRIISMGGAQKDCSDAGHLNSHLASM